MAVNFGKITGRIVRVLADSSADPDNDPDISPVDDSTVVIFTPKLLYGQSTTYGILLPQPITCPTVNGYIMSPGNITVPGVSLYPTDDPTTAPLNWTYSVNIKTPGSTVIGVFDISVPSGSTLDLAALIPAPSSSGVSVPSATAAAVRAETAAAAAAASVASAGGGGGGVIADGSISYAKLASAATAALLSRANHTGSQFASTIVDFTEAAQDAVAAMLTAGTGVTLAYNDAANTLSITGTAGGGVDVEAVRDAIGVALIGIGAISVTVNDTSDTITLSTTATVNATDAALRARASHTGTQSLDTTTDSATRLALTPDERTKLAGVSTARELGTGPVLPATGPGGTPLLHQDAFDLG